MMNIINIIPFQDHRIITFDVYYPQKRCAQVRRLMQKPPEIYTIIKGHSPWSITVGSDLNNPEKTVINLRFKLFLVDDEDDTVVSYLRVTYDFEYSSSFLYPTQIIISA